MCEYKFSELLHIFLPKRECFSKRKNIQKNTICKPKCHTKTFMRIVIVIVNTSDNKFKCTSNTLTAVYMQTLSETSSSTTTTYILYE